MATNTQRVAVDSDGSVWWEESDGEWSCADVRGSFTQDAIWLNWGCRLNIVEIEIPE